MKFIQKKYIKKFTDVGFKKEKIDKDIFRLLKESYEANFNFPPDENMMENYVQVVQNSKDDRNKTYWNRDKNLNMNLALSLQKQHEDFFGIKLTPQSVYGPRMYTRDSIVIPHIDNYKRRLLGSIINIDKKLEEDWAFEIYDNYGKLHEIYLEPGEILMYESARLTHSRKKPLKGDYYVNIFLHYLPEYWLLDVDRWEKDMWFECGVDGEFDFVLECTYDK